MIPISTKSLGTNPTTGLEDRIVVWQLTIDAQAEKVVVVYKIETISPTSVVVATSDNMVYERYNRPATLYSEGETITPVILDVDGVTVITPAVIASGVEVKVAGNLKFNILRASALGQGITSIINSDLTSIQSSATLSDDLLQK